MNSRIPRDWKKDGNLVYALNSKGYNFFSAGVQSAHTEDEATKEEVNEIVNLIAAAPHLLEACKRIQRKRELNKPITLGDLDSVDKAIAKAEKEK
jgi:hypothetical protein